MHEVVAIEISQGVGLSFADGDAGVAEVDPGSPENFGSAFGPVVGPGCFLIVDAISCWTPPDAPFRWGRKKGEGGGEEKGGEFHRVAGEC